MGAGQSIIAQAGLAPVRREIAFPRDAVQWALYYPLILDLKPADFADIKSDWQQKVQKSIAFYWKNDLPEAFSSLTGIAEDIDDPSFFIYRATLLLTVGRVDAASADLMKALKLEPGNGHATALQSVIAVSQGNKGEALRLAEKAVELEPASPAPRVALSYAQQAHFDVKGALESLKDAVKLDPGNALVWARLSEMHLSVGDLDRSLESAEEAVHLNPNLARTQTVLGFAYLTQIKTEESKEAFKNAIKLDQADPLPRLGLGLAKIREGDLGEGRRELEIAVSLDPNNSLIRSYLGKAYFDEKSDKLASEQFAVAKQLDPMDPTPWFYDGIQKQTLNRPVEALDDFQKSIQLNDNRAVYRSQLLLDQDLAARSASLARTYEDLGFQQLALVEGWRSLNTDPANYSAHRFLADLYDSLPRHEIARVSELLQSQLLQPLNITPVQPELAESKLFILGGAGPTEVSFNEFNPLFNRNRLTLLACGLAGSHDTLSDEVVLSGVWQEASFSVGQFHYQTDGFRVNDDFEQDIYNAFAQFSLSPKTSIQGEYRTRELDRGDIFLFFDPSLHLPDLRELEDYGFYRFGFHHAFAPGSDLVTNIGYRTRDYEQNLPGFKLTTDETWYGGEIQHSYNAGWFSTIVGGGSFSRELDEITTIDAESLPFDTDTPHSNVYVYSNIHFPKSAVWTVGGSVDFYEGGYFDLDVEQFNPKFGLTWNISPNTVIRAAAFRTFKRPLLSDQTIEPTQVAGFIQFFDDGETTDAWRYGVGVDQKLSQQLYGGVEFSRRDLTVSAISFTFETKEANVEETLVRSYLYWTPFPWLALGPEYQFERFDNTETLPLYDALEVRTHRVSLGVGMFHPSGFLAKLKPTFVIQEGEFLGSEISSDGTPLFVGDDSEFFVLDASIGYRLPRRLGILELEARNLFDESFKFQNTDPANPDILPEQFIAARFTLAF
jgi:tetratricopeptide (TPR) repeat protein